MISKALVETLFKAFSIERWNDKLRPIELMQMDKHAHKMMIAYCLAKYEEGNGYEVNWLEIIKGGIYELMRRSVISDIQSPVYREIALNTKLLNKLNFMIYKEIENKIEHQSIRSEFEQYLMNPEYLSERSKKILDAANKYSTYWEFQIVKNANPTGYKIQDIAAQLTKELEAYSDLEGIKKLHRNHQIKNFVDMCGELRFQIRWGHIPRIPKTSVLGHVMLVASLGYFITFEIENACPKRFYNNFFGGLFHDLPEVVTRDIIKPVKLSVPGMHDEIKRIEIQLAEEEIYPNIEKEWLSEMKFFTQDEFAPKIGDGIIVSADDISKKYNKDEFNPYDGSLLKACDDFAAYLEAWSSIDYGIKSKELEDALGSIKAKYKDVVIAGVPVYKFYQDF